MRILAAALALFLPILASAQAPQATTRVTWLGHATFLVQTPGGANLVIDPWLQNAPADYKLPEKLDAVLVSHGHFDHVADARRLAGGDVQLIGVNELVQLLDPKRMGANTGGSFRIKDATIHLVEAVHSSSYTPEEGGPAQYAGNPVGFVIAIDNGPTLYHAGDTALFQGMELIGRVHRPDVAILPIGGHFTMGPKDAATAVKLLGAKTVIPMHFGTFPVLLGTPDQLAAELKAQKVNAKVQVPELGKAAAF